MSQGEITRNVVHLSAEAQRDVPNEVFHLVMFIEERGDNPADVAQIINRTMASAIDVAKGASGVKVSSGAYNTTPVYDRKSVRKAPVWQGRQELFLESQNLDGLLDLASKLQGQLQIRNVGYSVTPATRKQIENELIDEALSAFHDRAKVVSRHVAGGSYEIVEIHINTGRTHNPVSYRKHGGPAMAMAAESGPAMEGGTSKVSVSVQGSVRFAP